MNKAVLNRKRQISTLVERVKKCSVKNEFRIEMMTYAYVLANGAFEFMVETILREWVADNVKKHSNSKRYRGKNGVSSYLEINVETSNDIIAKFNNPDFQKIVELIKSIAGKNIRDRFKQLVQSSKATEPELNSKLCRINNFRHRLAHGETLPLQEQPNIDELSADFECVFEHIIKNIDNALNKRKTN